MRMRARTVDWALFILIAFELVSGLASFTVGKPEGRPLFVIHGMVGLSIVILLFWKLRRVRSRVLKPRRWEKATIVSILVALCAVASLATGLIWTVVQRPIGYPNGMILHTTFGIGLVILYLWHMILRYRPLSRRDVSDRRSALSAIGVLAAGGAAWIAQDRGVKRLQTPGAQRRFTGSRAAGPGQGNEAFPVTMWMFDRPAPLDLARFQLHVGGMVAQEATYSLDQLGVLMQAEQTSTIDCTGGWYSTQRWQGISAAHLMEMAQPSPTARFVSFISATGYRWSLPIDEASGALLATHVGGELLSHGHGAPLRLVAPGRRGFQWVKWVVALHVTDRADFGQWGTIFTSGLRQVGSADNRKISLTNGDGPL